jgi:hypothetical protein
MSEYTLNTLHFSRRIYKDSHVDVTTNLIRKLRKILPESPEESYEN